MTAYQRRFAVWVVVLVVAVMMWLVGSVLSMKESARKITARVEHLENPTLPSVPYP